MFYNKFLFENLVFDKRVEKFLTLHFILISKLKTNNMHSPSSKSVTTNEDSDISTPAGRSPESPTSESPSSPVKNTLTKLPGKDISSSVIEQTPTRFLAACSKHDLEPNPFEQSFSGANPLSESTGTNSPKPSLPSVAQLASPSTGIPANEDQYGWNLQSLRSGPLSPSMLAGPQETIIFDDLSRTTGRTGTTPLPFGSFTDASPGTAALFGATGSTTSFMNSIPVMAMSNSTNAPDHFSRNVFTQGVPKPLTDSERKTISTNSGASVSVSGVSTVPSSQPGVVQSSVATTNLLGMNNGSNASASAMAIISRNLMTDNIMPKTEKDEFTQSSNSIVVLNGTHTNGISSNISQHKGSVLTGQSIDHDSSRSPSSSPIKSSSRNARRKAEDNLISDQPPSKKNGQKSKSDMTDEEKRRNFLERNRQAALKCRQRKKQWLANLQAKVEYLTNDNETLQNQAQSLREEILNLKTLLLAHKDCPIAQANGVMGLDTIPSMQQNMSGMNVGHSMNVGVGMVPGTIQGTNAGMQNVQGTMAMSNVQVPPHMSNHGPPGSGMLRY
ncbi:hypothetical protein C1645_735663 [Glomus cerebriforme]|uniref:BZIP domain-containing protein n=1 Tax=Glomus cerebriforme TaxID=658196 RepID=A0A397T4K0_9GLOM|nr:hypothetical protein C1645_735663 [Glomus cerebriforme]